MLNLLLVIATLYCAFQVMNSARLLNATIWLAFTSAFTAILIYILGAPEVAVIELSVGAGLVTVLFVFAFSIVGEATLDTLTIVPRWVVWILVLVTAVVLGWFVFPLPGTVFNEQQGSFEEMLWQYRGLDVIAQIVLIFSGIMGLIGLLSETRLTPTSHRPPIITNTNSKTDSHIVASNEAVEDQNATLEIANGSHQHNPLVEEI